MSGLPTVGCEAGICVNLASVISCDSCLVDNIFQQTFSCHWASPAGPNGRCAIAGLYVFLCWGLLLLPHSLGVVSRYDLCHVGRCSVCHFDRVSVEDRV